MLVRLAELHRRVRNQRPPRLRTIGEAVTHGAGWHEAESAHDYRWPEATQLGAGAVDFLALLEPRMPALGVVELPGGLVHGRDAWVFDQQRKLLSELSWYGWHSGQLFSGEHDLRPRKRVRHLSGKALTLGSTWGGHFGHFIPDALGRLAVFNAAGGRLDDVEHVLLPPVPDSPTARRLIERVGLRSDQIRSLDGRTFTADRLLAPTMPGIRRQYAPLLVHLLRTHMPNQHQTRRLFVSRRGYGRNPVGLDRLEAVAVAQGFEIYDPMRSRDQAVDFAAASVVVGVSGSALTNIAFCQPGTTVIELFSDAHLYGYYYSLAGAAALRYGYLVGSSGEQPKFIGASNADFHLDLDEVKSALDWAVNCR